MCYSLITWFRDHRRPRTLSMYHDGVLAAVAWAAQLLVHQEEGSYHRAALFDERGEEVWSTDGNENGALA